MARKVAKAGAAKGGSCRGFSGPGDRCHLAVSKRHRNTIWQQTRPAKGQRVEAGEAYATGMARNVAKAGAATGGSCSVVFQALVTDAIWQFRNDIETYVICLFLSRFIFSRPKNCSHSSLSDSISHDRQQLQGTGQQGYYLGALVPMVPMRCSKIRMWSTH